MLPAFWQNLPAKQGETGFGVETAPPASQCRLSGACPAPRISATFRTATDAQARLILPDLFMGEIGSGVHTPNKQIIGSQKFGTMAAD